MDYITINKSSLVPLYSQLKESIKEAIQNGILKPGDKLPTEHEICNHFNLSRTVTRQAFYELMSEGYIVRYKSRGTFVNQQSKENVFFKEIISFNDEMKMYGFEPKTELISIEKFICNDYIAEKSEFNVGDELIRIQRLRYRNDDPIVFVVSFPRLSPFIFIITLVIDNNISGITNIFNKSINPPPTNPYHPDNSLIQAISFGESGNLATACTITPKTNPKTVPVVILVEKLTFFF